MSDAFEEIQAIKIKRNSYREKLQKRKRERHELLTFTPIPSTLTTESCPGNYYALYYHYIIQNYSCLIQRRIYS